MNRNFQLPTMDRPGFSSPPFNDKKIVLSPPPIESKQYSFLQQHNANSGPPVAFQERQQSVGYNLQQEFETLTADLDLDLRNNKDMQQNVDAPLPTTQSGNVGRGMMPSTLQYGFGELGTGGSLQNALLTDAALSPNLPTASSHSALGSLLNNNGNGSFLPPLASIPNRPQSVNDFSNFFNRQQQQQQTIDRQQQQQATNFYLDLIVFCNWIETLNPRDNITMIDYLCNNLPLDILLTFKSKLDSHLTHYHNQLATSQPLHQQQNQPVSFGVLSPYQQQQNDILAEMENLNLDNSLSSDAGASLNQKSAPALQQPKPKLNSVRNHGLHLYAEQQTQRPRSADPNIHKYSPNYNLPQQQFERTKSPTSHLYEKTNFLQLAAANSNPPSVSQQKGANNSDDSVDLSAHAALKLGALATINSRVALDSNRKSHVHSAHGHQQPHSHYFPQQGALQHGPFLPASAYEESINRSANSSSVPILVQHNKSPPGLTRSKKSTEGLGQGANASSGSPQTTSTTSMPADISNPDLLNNIPAWLKLLRLHKYTDCLKDIYWKDLIEYDDLLLEKRGVKALGARRKLLKAFDAVKESS